MTTTMHPHDGVEIDNEIDDTTLVFDTSADADVFGLANDVDSEAAAEHLVAAERPLA